MADVMPNYGVEIQRLKMQIAAQHATVERQRLENLEMDDRQQRNNENIEAAFRAIEDLEGKLESLQETHQPGSSKRAKEKE